MTDFQVTHQESYSRGQLLLRTFLGAFYIALPHMFLLFFYTLVAKFMWIISSFSILLGKGFPEKHFDFQLNVLRWLARVHLSLYNLCDGYPPFGLKARYPCMKFEVYYNQYPDRLQTLWRFLFGPIYILLPHFFALLLRNIVGNILVFLAFFAVLFTGKYPEKWHRFNVGTLRWTLRIFTHLLHMDPQYPPFSGK